MYYLLRLAEAGREAQAPRSRVRPDVLAVIGERLPQVRTTSWVGRVVVDADEDVLNVLEDIHSVISVSPCQVVALRDLDEAVDRIAAQTMPGARTFRIAVKRSGDHAFNSHDKAAELGGRVLGLFPELRVDLAQPERLVGVEIRDDVCYVYTRVVHGLDHRAHELADLGERPRFLIDQMLGRLLPWFRLLGFDTITVLDEADSKLQRIARAEHRLLLTKDLELSHSQAVNVYFVQGDDVLDQINEVLVRYGIELDESRMFSRCTLCNAPIHLVDKRDFVSRIPAEAYDQYDEFSHCADCDKIYWKGSQYERILDQLDELRAGRAQRGGSGHLGDAIA